MLNTPLKPLKRVQNRRTTLTSCVLAISLALTSTHAMAKIDPLRGEMSQTISAQARTDLTGLFDGAVNGPEIQVPQTTEAWDAQAKAVEKFAAPRQIEIANSLGVTLKEDTLGGVPVLRIYPKDYQQRKQVLIYVHGGGYVVLSAKSTLSTSSLLADASGLEVIAIDYTLAPHGNVNTATDQVIAVWKALLDSGVNPSSVGMFGDSAGGGLATGSILKMRDNDIPLPGALFLGSPWADVTDAGDSYLTLKDVDPVLQIGMLDAAADIYAPNEKTNPYVSPVYGDFSQPFPATLIQGGTRELFLSDFVRLYQAIKSGGHDVTLDLYEGMPHVFYSYTYTSPEGKAALTRQADFFHTHLQ